MANNAKKLESYRSGPDDTGHFGIYGGRFVAETLMPLVLEVEKAYKKASRDPEFQQEFNFYAGITKPKLDDCEVGKTFSLKVAVMVTVESALTNN